MQSDYCSDAEFSRDKAYHFTLQSSNSSVEPEKPSMMNAQHKEARQKWGGRGKYRNQFKQEIKIPAGVKIPQCVQLHGQLMQQGLKKYEEQSQLPLQVPEGRI